MKMETQGVFGMFVVSSWMNLKVGNVEQEVESSAPREEASFLACQVSLTRLGYAIVAVLLFAAMAYPYLKRWAGQPDELELLPPVELSESGKTKLSFH